MTHSAKYRVGEFDFDTTRFPRGKWGFLRKSSGSGPPHGGVPTSGANSNSVETSIKNLCAEIDNQMQSSIIFNLPDPPKIPPTPRTDKIEIFFFRCVFSV